MILQTRRKDAIADSASEISNPPGPKGVERVSTGSKFWNDHKQSAAECVSLLVSIVKTETKYLNGRDRRRSGQKRCKKGDEILEPRSVL